MHLPEGFSKVLVEGKVGAVLAYWDIPTDVIPTPLRLIGSRFLVVANAVRPSEAENMTPEEIRLAIRVSAREIQDE